jgi:hypothetical protein
MSAVFFVDGVVSFVGLYQVYRNQYGLRLSGQPEQQAAHNFVLMFVFLWISPKPSQSLCRATSCCKWQCILDSRLCSLPCLTVIQGNSKLLSQQRLLEVPWHMLERLAWG